MFKSDFLKEFTLKLLSRVICLLSYKALWKRQDLGSEREAFIFCTSQTPLSAVILSFINIAIKGWGTDRRNTLCIAQMLLQW